MAHRFKVGDLITNGASAGRVIARVAHDPHWKTAGVRVANIALGPFGGNVGQTSFVPDYRSASWRRIVVGETNPVVGTNGAVTESYRWSADYSYLLRDVARADAAA